MAKVLVDYTEEGDVNILSDSEVQANTTDTFSVEKTANQTPYEIHKDFPVMEEIDDIDMKPDDTLESDEEDQESENEGEE